MPKEPVREGFRIETGLTRSRFLDEPLHHPAVLALRHSEGYQHAGLVLKIRNWNKKVLFLSFDIFKLSDCSVFSHRSEVPNTSTKTLKRGRVPFGPDVRPRPSPAATWQPCWQCFLAVVGFPPSGSQKLFQKISHVKKFNIFWKYQKTLRDSRLDVLGRHGGLLSVEPLGEDARSISGFELRKNEVCNRLNRV